MDIESVLDKIRSLRQEKGLSQEFLASCMGLTQPAYFKLENGKSSLRMDQYLKLCKCLGESPLSILAQSQEAIGGLVEEPMGAYESPKIQKLQKALEALQAYVHALEQTINP